MTVILRAWRWLVRSFAGDGGFLAVDVDDVPDRLLPTRVYVVGARGSPWSAAFLCPCGCQEVIQLSLMEDDSPSWSIRVDLAGRPTLRPSINRVRGCRSHFFVRAGRIEWAGGRHP